METVAVGVLALGLLVISVLWLLVRIIAGLAQWLRPQQADNLCPPIRLDQPRQIPPVTQAQPDPAAYDYDLVPWVTERGFGYAVKRVSDNLMLSWEFFEIRNGFESIPVSGAAHHATDLQQIALHPPSRLRLVPEPTNRYDANAVGVWDATETFQAGYIPKEEAKRIGNKLKKGLVTDCRSMWEIFDKGQRVSLRVLIIYEGARLRVPPLT